MNRLKSVKLVLFHILITKDTNKMVQNIVEFFFFFTLKVTAVASFEFVPLHVISTLY